MSQVPSTAEYPARVRLASPALRLRLLAGLLALCLGQLHADRLWAEETGPATVQALAKEYQGLLKHTDFASFSQRMAALRALGGLGTPEGQAVLLRVVKTSRRLDDEVVALMSMGPALDLRTAQELASFAGRRGGPVRIHALGLCFSEATDPAVLTWLSGAGLRAKNKGVRQAVADAQHFHADPRALKPLIEMFAEQSTKREGMDLASAAIRALGAIGARGGTGAVDKQQAGEVRRFLLRAVGNPDFRVRLAAAEVAAQQVPLDINMRGALRQLLGDESPVVRQATAEGIGKAKLEELIPELAARLNDVHIKTRDVAHTALIAITGKDLGYDADHWQTWFKHRAESEVPAKSSPSASVTSYYGVRVHSDRMLFIVDLSGSMAFPWGQDTTRIDVARAELRRVLKGLNPDSLFNIIVFSDKVKAWRKGEILATPDAVERALAWMGKTFKEPRGGTYMHAALEKAFAENAKVDTIFLLTDGLATDGEPIVPEAILASVSSWNRYRGVTIHTFALTLEKLDKKGIHRRNLADIKKFMRQLAHLTGGVARVVDDIPEDVKNDVLGKRAHK